MARGFKVVEGLHYLFSKTKVLKRGWATAKLICVFISHMQIFLPFFVSMYFSFIYFIENLDFYMKIWHIPKIDLSFPHPFKY